MSSMRRSHSCRRLDEIFRNFLYHDGVSVEIACKDVIFSMSSVNNCNPMILEIIGKSILYKKYGDNLLTYILSKNTLGPLRQIPLSIKEPAFSHKYYLRLACLIEYFKAECSNASGILFLGLIERIVDEIRPALFLRLINPNLDRLITG
jgi:hypothetical protein